MQRGFTSKGCLSIHGLHKGSIGSHLPALARADHDAQWEII